MREVNVFTAAFLLAFAILPLSYVALSVWMLVRRAWWFTYIAYFVVFGSFGGWGLVIFAAAAKGSGIIATLGFEAFLLTCGMAACLISAVVIHRREKKDQFDRGAMLGSYSFIALHSIFLFSCFLCAALLHP